MIPLLKYGCCLYSAFNFEINEYRKFARVLGMLILSHSKGLPWSAHPLKPDLRGLDRITINLKGQKIISHLVSTILI